MKKYQSNKKIPIYLFIGLIVFVAFIVIIIIDESSKRGNDMLMSVNDKVNVSPITIEPIAPKPIIENANESVRIVIAERYENTSVIYASLILVENKNVNDIYLSPSEDIKITERAIADHNKLHLKFERKDGSCNFTKDDKITVHS